MKFARIRHDREQRRDCLTGELVENARQNDACWKFKKDKIYPAPEKHFTAPNGSTNTRRMSRAWFDFVGKINTAIAWLKARVNWSGYFNSASNPEYKPGETIPLDPDLVPKPEGITSIENIVKVLERKTVNGVGWTRFETFKYSDTPPDPEKVNPKTHPWLFCKFTSIAPNGDVGLAPNGLEFYFPYLAANEAWIKDEKLEFDVELPVVDWPPKESENMLPLWRDYSSNQGTIDMDVAALNGVLGMYSRASISWGFKDPWFPIYWELAKQAGIYRTSYHVIYTDQPIEKQVDNWFAAHPKIDVIPRVIDLEVDRGDSDEAKAAAVAEMSALVLARDGIRPMIYSRRLLIDAWLKSWTDEQLNEHYYILAQYRTDRSAEWEGLPDLPKRVGRDRVLLHQTADKKAGFPGEVESAAADYNRWQIGDEEEMHAFIANEFAGIPPDEPPTDPPPSPDLDGLRDSIHQAIDVEFNKVS